MIKLKYPRLVKTLNLCFLALSLMVSWSCNDQSGSILLPPSTGQPGEILIVIDSSVWSSSVGDTLNKCFAITQPGLPEAEPMFDIIHIIPRAFTDIFKTTGNIFIVEFDDGNKSRYGMKENVWAKNQIVVRLIAKSHQEAARIIGKNKAALRKLFLNSGQQKVKQHILSSVSPLISQEAELKLNARFKIPQGYEKVSELDNAIYFRKDLNIGAHSVIQGIVAYRLNYTTASDLHVSSLLNYRDSITKKLIKGSQPTYYMETYRLYQPDSTNFQTSASNYAKQLRGLWRMNGEFMGGPFVNLTILDEKNSNLLVIDGFVYAPKFSKRKYIRELEAIAELTELQ